MKLDHAATWPLAYQSKRLYDRLANIILTRK
jgi:hypothetical protein